MPIRAFRTLDGAVRRGSDVAPTLRTLSLYRSSPLEGRLSDEAVTQSGEPLGDLVGG